MTANSLSTSSSNPEVPNTGVAEPSRSPNGPIQLLAKIFAMAAMAVVLVLAIFWFVPDANDYALITNDKHARLSVDTPCKIVFVGGSNLAFGLDSSLVEQDLGCHAVNMGMSGLLGARFLTEEVKPELRPGDIVVISMEYDSYFRTANGQGTDLIMMVKARPSSARYVTHVSQYLKVAKSFPLAAHLKLVRLLRERFQPQTESGASQFINTIETQAGFNKYGDLVSHLGVKWPYEKEQGLDLTTGTRDALTIPILNAFAEDMQARGVKVLLLHTPAMESYYRQHRASIERVHQDLKSSTKLLGLTPPSQYVFPESLFFDTVYHLNETGRSIRTRKVIEDIRRYVGIDKLAVARQG